MKALTDHFTTMKAVIFSPKTFFAKTSETEGFGKSTIFAVINTILTIIIAAFFALLRSTSSRQLYLILIGSIFIVPLTIIFLFICAFILHLITKILHGKGKFIGSYQVLTYTSAISPLTSIPFLAFLAIIYQIYAVILGFRQIHKYSTAKAIITVLLPLLVFVIIIIFFLLLIGIISFPNI